MPDAPNARATARPPLPETKNPAKRALRSPNAEDLKIAAKLKSLRQVRGMTLPFVAVRIGVTPQQIQKYETGHNRIAAGILNRLANLYGVPGSHFFGDETLEQGGLSEIVKLVDAPDARQLVHAFAAIRKPALRRAILSIVKSTAETAQLSELPATPRRAVPKPTRSTSEK